MHVPCFPHSCSQNDSSLPEMSFQNFVLSIANDICSAARCAPSA